MRGRIGSIFFSFDSKKFFAFSQARARLETSLFSCGEEEHTQMVLLTLKTKASAGEEEEHSTSLLFFVAAIFVVDNVAADRATVRAANAATGLAAPPALAVECMERMECLCSRSREADR